MSTRWLIRLGLLMAAAVSARADITLLLEEPYGTFGGMNPTGHAAIYLSRVCAKTPLSLRRCNPGETGVVISRYHRVGGYDWIAIPLIPYLYAVDTADQAPMWASPEGAAALRDNYRRAHLKEIIPDDSDGSTPSGDWTQLVGEAYDRTIYAFGIESSEKQDDEFIQLLNSRINRTRFNLFFQNCADFSRQVIDFYYPRAVRRNFTADVGIMTPKQAAKSLLRYSKKHDDLQFSIFMIAQVPGTVPRSSSVRGVLESLAKSKRYALPLAPLAVLHPAIGGGMAYALVESSHFNARRIATAAGGLPLKPNVVVTGLQSNDTASSPREPAETGCSISCQ